MARILKSYPFQSREPHPWKLWADGRIWKLQRGRDFTCNPFGLRRRIYMRATQLGMKANVSVAPSKQVVVFQFRGAAGRGGT